MNSITPNPSESQQSTVANWKEIDLSQPYGLRLLQRAVAERLGYKVQRGDLGWQVFDPKNTRVTYSYDGENYAWGSALSWKIPNYSSDVNAALELIETVKASFRLDSNAPGMWRAWFSPMGTMKNADTPAKAICLAWLDWQDANGGQS